ncbi:MAG: hypothetical protein OEU54_15855 [Gemmatimonadota bacterium]|nr:hypothetical protein [Gemmatimonadota bacterium]
MTIEPTVKWLPGLLVSLLMAGGALPATAQDPFTMGPYRPFQFMLPIDFTQGLTTDRGSPVPYTASLRVYPIVVLDSHGRWRAGASTSLTFRNPKVEFWVGPRLSYRVMTWGLDENGLDLAFEALFGSDGGDELALGLTGDLARLFRIGFRAGRDITRDEFRFEIALGSDPLAWFGGNTESDLER